MRSSGAEAEHRDAMERLAAMEPSERLRLALFAGSRRDDNDILELLDHLDGLREEVDAIIGTLPAAERARWEKLRRQE